MELTRQGIQAREAWQRANIELPHYDVSRMADSTRQHPTWLHIGAGNIFRGYVARLQQQLLNSGDADSGIVAIESFDPEIIDRIYAPHYSLALLVGLKADGAMQKEVIGSIACGLKAVPGTPDMDEIMRMAADPQLQMISFTITEKGYALRDLNGELLPAAAHDREHGFAEPAHVMGLTAAMLYQRYRNGAAPIALCSFDNCSHNGDRLRAAVMDIARSWCDRGFAEKGFLAYIEDSKKVSFPWSMIDKITPRPSEVVARELAAIGVQDMAPVATHKGTYIAPFVNAELPEYLVIEDRFPNGRPPLERAGVYFADKTTVDKVERMKVTACLNPLHTALAVYGCLLGYDSIAEEMHDPELRALAERLGYDESLPTVESPGIIEPKAFLDEVIHERLPNAFLGDTPQRIATDTSQKMPIRFGVTIKAYHDAPNRSVDTLVCVPLAIAGWLRYLLGVDNMLAPMLISADPMLDTLRGLLSSVAVEQEPANGVLRPILSNEALFGCNLYEVGLAHRVEIMFAELTQGEGAVRRTLKRYLG